MNFFKRKSLKLLYLFLSVILLMGYTNKSLPLDKEDQKKLEKAAKLNQDAQELLDKANSIYSEIAQYDRSEANNIKKIEKLEDNAIDLQIKALILQGEANWLEKSVYKKVIPLLKADYSNDIPVELSLLEDKTGELFLKAENFKNEADRFGEDEKYQKYSKLTEAQKLEKESIENQKELIQYYLGEKSINFENQSKENQQEEVVINEEILKSYLNYVNSQDTLVSVDDFRNLLYSGQFSAASFRNIWDNYIYTGVFYADRTDSLDIDIIAEAEPDSKGSEYDIPAEKNVLEGAVFKVQIASDKSPLTQNHLKQIYDGNKKVQMVSEEGWYKYSIGDFNTYAEAEEFKRSLKITDAFIVAYANNKKVDLLALKKEKKGAKNKKASPVIKGLIFKVQIAASRNRLPDTALSNIYGGNEPVNMIVEDDWYKYSLGNFERFGQAETLKDRINVDGAFIVAYQNGVKIPLYLAKKGVVKESPDKKIKFKVQIAADIKPLSSEKLHNIYSGYENIDRYEEGGWNKYSIGDFETFNEANELRKACNVGGAFVIAFRGNEKINVLEAKRLTRCLDPVFHKGWLKSNVSLVFKVQIAASLKELNENQIKNICCIEQDVYVTKEDEWYRYSIGNFKTYNEALRLKNISNVNGAFIVPYKNGEKMNLKEAIKLSK